MIRQLLQLIGMGCLTAGAVLFFTSGTEDEEYVNQGKVIAELNQELATVKVALADAQKDTKANDEAAVSTQKSDDSGKKDSVIKMILTLSPGDTSKDASDFLEKSGIIKSATEFEGYLTKNGLSGKMQIGQHEVDSSMNFADLAKELTTIKH
ncbi:endolytic transglycosylase MltG [Sporosarcina aquimarina]|uniref:endolytic transglycosylase MltG n=1 Tax=Sporosarcina aquimarina TaxID=114975 RepID=UPI00203D8A9A|nr:endolytic transglycosylase MltG [Sporosarcina aquimarina]MCM3756997.1 endolytic transglycosylase MltG [Sporosarcina aquimarina]